MVEKDMRPTRHRLTIRFAQEFVTEYFEQNPISQLGIIGMRDGLAVRVSDMSGNPNDHISSLQKWRDQDPTGQASLQNAMEMARGALFNAPSHGTREVLLVMGALVSADPGDIHSTITALVSAHITVRVIGLAAELAICRTLATRTNPNLNSTSTYHVARHEQHYRELIMDATTPPPTAAPSATSAATGTGADGQQNSLLMMGFPSRVVESAPSFCACHSKPSLGGYLCSRCRSKVCSLPTTCPACSLTLILSTHLARSYHHLFPLKNWAEVSWERAAKKPDQRECFSCLAVFPELEKQDTREERAQVVEQAKKKGMTKGNEKRDGGVSESGRYECETCKHFFCIDCDVFCHETVHNCPGCQSSEGRLMAEAQAAAHNGAMEGVEA
jgi:transcription initiation factor TFIIH subunit 2